MHLKIFLLKPLKEWRFFQLFFAGSGYVKDVLLPSFHSRYVLIQGCQFTLGLGAARVTSISKLLPNENWEITLPSLVITSRSNIPLKSEQFCQPISVSGILNDTKFNGFTKLIPELDILTFLLIVVRGCIFCINI